MSAAEFFEDETRDLCRDAVLALRDARDRTRAPFDRDAARAAALCKVRAEDAEREAFIERESANLPPVTLPQARNDAVDRLTHPNGCVCPKCDPREFTCLRCGKSITGKLQYGAHVATHKRQRKAKPVLLEADGIGFVRRAVSERELAQAINLGAMTRFQQMLHARLPRNRATRLSRLDKATIATLEAMDLHAPVPLPKGLTTAGSAVAIYKLALLAGVTPQTVVGVLCMYGLEHLAQELRASRKAPEAHTPQMTTDAKVQPSKRLFVEREIS